MANYDNWYNTSTGEKQTVSGSQNPSGPGTWTTKNPSDSGPSYHGSSSSTTTKPKMTVHIPPAPVRPEKPEELYYPTYEDTQFNGSIASFDYDKQINVKKYEYFYGIKNIGISCNEYSKSSIFVSKPIKVDGNTLKVELYSEEEHPDPPKDIMDNVKSVTSIEYYVTNLKAPSADQWIPILPKGQNVIYSEKLFLKNNQASTRFLASLDQTNKVTVRKNNKILSENEYIIFNDIDNKTTIIKFAGNSSTYIQSNNIYTIDYIPESKLLDPYAIIFDKGNSYLQEITESFDGANNDCTIELKHIPYIDKELIYQLNDYNPNTNDYRPIEVKIVGEFLGPNDNKIKEIKPYYSEDVPSTYNKTDYISMNQPLLNNYNLTEPANLKFEYYHDGKKLHFTEPFKYSNSLLNKDLLHGSGVLTVKYSYIVPNIIIKIITRNNDTSPITSTTPFLKSFTLKISYSK